MIFTLIKNELIKLMKRPKTWIVFALFAVLAFGGIFLNYKSAKDSRYNNSPQGKIERLNENLNYANERLANFEKNKDSSEIGDIEETKLEIESYKKQIAIQEELAKHVDEPDFWKQTLLEEKAQLEQSYNSIEKKQVNESYKEYMQSRIAEINKYLENNEKPIPEWEFDAVNYGKGLLGILGMVILASGIAVFMSDIVSGEATPPTLKFLLVQPITRGKVIASKFIAIVITVVSMICGLEIIAFGIVGALGGFGGGNMPQEAGAKYEWFFNGTGGKELRLIDNTSFMSTRGDVLLQSFLLQILFIIACCAFIFLISAIFKSSMTTMAISVILSVASTMVCVASTTTSKIAHLIFFNYGSTENIITGNVATMYKNPNFSIGLGVALMGGTIVISYMLANLIFNKKDILI